MSDILSDKLLGLLLQPREATESPLLTREHPEGKKVEKNICTSTFFRQVCQAMWRPQEGRPKARHWQKPSASADRVGFPPLWPPSRSMAATRLLSSPLSAASLGIGRTTRGVGLSTLKRPQDVDEHLRPLDVSLRIHPECRSCIFVAACRRLPYLLGAVVLHRAKSPSRPHKLKVERPGVFP